MLFKLSKIVLLLSISLTLTSNTFAESKDFEDHLFVQGVRAACEVDPLGCNEFVNELLKQNEANRLAFIHRTITGETIDNLPAALQGGANNINGRNHFVRFLLPPTPAFPVRRRQPIPEAQPTHTPTPGPTPFGSNPNPFPEPFAPEITEPISETYSVEKVHY